MSKRHAYEIIEIIDDVEDLVKKLGRWFERRRPKLAKHILSEHEVPRNLDRYRPGNRYGRYDEIILRREVRTEGIPNWFDPREVPGQFGIIGDDGMRCYIEVDLDIPQRNLPSIFDSQIATLVEANVEQTSLF